MKSADYELLCPNGGRVPVDQYEKCHLLKAPPHMVIQLFHIIYMQLICINFYMEMKTFQLQVVASNSKTNSDINEIQSTLISASELYSSRPDWFKLFGTFNGKKDLLFKVLFLK